MQQFSGICSITVYYNPNRCQNTDRRVFSPPLNLHQFSPNHNFNLLLSADHPSRKKNYPLIWPVLVSYRIFILVVGFYMEKEEAEGSTDIIMAGIFLFVSVYGFSLGPVTWLYIAEIV